MNLVKEPTADDPFIVENDPERLKAHAVRGSVITGAVQIAKMVMQFTATVLLGRLLFPSDFGLMAMVYPIIGFVQLFGNLGFGDAVIQRHDMNRTDASSLFWLNFLVSIGLMAVAMALSPLAGWLYGDDRIMPLMIIAAALLPVSALGSIHVAILSRQMRFAVRSTNDLASTLFGLSATVFSAWYGFGYWSLVLGQAVTSISNCLLAWARLRWLPSKPVLSRQLRQDVGFGANITGANIATFITASGDSIIIGAVNGETALGIYDRSYRLVVQPIGQVLVPISSVAIPHLSRLLGNDVEYRKVYLNFIRIICMLTIPLMVICTLNARAIVEIVLGPNWIAAATTFRWISIGGFLSGVYSSLVWLFVSQARTASMRRYMTISSVFNLLSFAVGTLWGVEGVAASAAIVFLTVSVPLVTHGATRVGPVRTMDLVRCCLPYLILVPLLALAFHLLAIRIDSGLHLLIASSAIILSCYLTLCFLLPDERRIVLDAAGKLGKRL